VMTSHGGRVAGDHDVESSRQKKLKWFFRIRGNIVPHNYQTTNEMNADHQNAQNADAPVIVAEEHSGMTVRKMPLKNPLTEKRVYEIADGVRETLTQEVEEKLAEMRRQMEDEMTAKFQQMLSTVHPKIEKQSKKAEKALAKEQEVRGYYDVPAGQDEIARLRKINAELRKTSEGQINTNRKLQERIDELEGEDPVRVYAEERDRVKAINQQLRKRCEAKDRTYQKMKAMIELLGGKAPEEE